ncbi:MAG: hypothetical protein IKP50_00060 [Bacilli bacterium]|nr:hypothetical protein [Bacilli bacterium]
MDNGLSAADVALLNRDNDFGFGGGGAFMWIFALLILAGGGFGGFGNNGFANAIGYENLATSNEVQRGFDNQNSMANQREILSAVNAGTAQAVAATNQTFHDTLGIIQNRYDELARDISGIAVAQAQTVANQNQCCCDTKMLIQQTSADTNANIAQSRYDAAMNTASINATTTAQTQRILDALAQDKIETLQNQVNQLQLAQAVAGVVRYPMQSTYCSGANPFCGCGCGA